MVFVRDISGFGAWVEGRLPMRVVAGAIHGVSEPRVYLPADGGHAFRNLGRAVYPLDDV